jgi:ElaB/YqjD/DUF883 family membrane-anchored ribosome-binding protein
MDASSAEITDDGVRVEDLDFKTKAKALPERYFDFLNARVEKDNQVGALLTAGNFRAIKHYARTVDDLPRNIEDLHESADLAALGVDPERVMGLYESLHEHVDDWDELEKMIKELGPEIELFADKLTNRGGALLANIEDSVSYQEVLSQKKSSPDGSADYPLLGEDFEKLRSVIRRGIQSLIKEIEDTSQSVALVNQRADQFKRDIKVKIKPRLKRVRKHVDDTLKKVDVSELRAELDEVDDHIQRLQDDYSWQVGLSFSGMLVGPVGLIISGGVFGSKAENIRARKNEKIAHRKKLVEKMAALEPARVSVESVQTIIEDLEFRSQDLSSAAGRLADVWLFLNGFAKNSISEINELSSSSDLDAFIHDFIEVISPWEVIGGVCAKLSRVFEELLEESEHD